MIWNLLKILPKRALGVDIGTSFIRVAEMSRIGGKIKLENYGESKALAFYEKPFRTFEKNTLLLSNKDISRAILAILEEARIKTKRAVFSIPDFSTFFTWFSLPPMTQGEIPSAVRYEAQQHIPLPISEVALDWQIIEGKASDHQQSRLKILLAAVPKEIIFQYQEIASLTNLELKAVEAEVFALARSAIRNETITTALLDIGAQSTTISIIDNRLLKRSHSFDVSGNEMTKVIAKSLSASSDDAENIKIKCGLNPISQFAATPLPPGQDLRNLLCPLIDLIILELEKITQDFFREEAKDIQKIIISGGSALLPGLKEYFIERIKKPVEIANPFADVFYPPLLEETIKQMSPSFAIAAGAALRGLE